MPTYGFDGLRKFSFLSIRSLGFGHNHGPGRFLYRQSSFNEVLNFDILVYFGPMQQATLSAYFKMTPLPSGGAFQAWETSIRDTNTPSIR